MCTFSTSSQLQTQYITSEILPESEHDFENTTDIHWNYLRVSECGNVRLSDHELERAKVMLTFPVVIPCTPSIILSSSSDTASGQSILLPSTRTGASDTWPSDSSP